MIIVFYNVELEICRESKRVGLLIDFGLRYRDFISAEKLSSNNQCFLRKGQVENSSKNDLCLVLSDVKSFVLSKTICLKSAI